MEFELYVLWAFVPFLLTLLVLKSILRVVRWIVLVLLAGLLLGCGTTSNKFDKSPCACQFQPFESNDEVEARHV